MFAPARIPRITEDMLDMIMKGCEIAAMSFVIALIAHITSPDVVNRAVVIACGIVFAVLIFLIKLHDYQKKIEQYRYYGFRI